MENSVDPDQTPRFAVSDLGSQCLLGHVYVNISSKYGASVIRIEHKRNICRHQEIEFLVLGIKQDTTFFRESLINKGDYFCDFL